MFTRNLSILLVAVIALLLTTAGQVSALPTIVNHFDDPTHCDPLFIPSLVDEIGDPGAGFPVDEILSHEDLGITAPVCLPSDLPAIPDALVSITNLSGRDFDEVWYVADRDTTITNYDGFANDFAFPGGQEAFRIDRLASDLLGLHHPLIAEDATPDGIWEAGETWEFVLQDYGNLAGLPPDAITSIGVGDASVDVLGFVASSGSIIAIPSIVPEPGSLVLVLLGMSSLGLITRRQRG